MFQHYQFQFKVIQLQLVVVEQVHLGLLQEEEDRVQIQFLVL